MKLSFHISVIVVVCIASSAESSKINFKELIIQHNQCYLNRAKDYFKRRWCHIQFQQIKCHFVFKKHTEEFSRINFVELVPQRALTRG